MIDIRDIHKLVSNFSGSVDRLGADERGLMDAVIDKRTDALGKIDFDAAHQDLCNLYVGCTEGRPGAAVDRYTMRKMTGAIRAQTRPQTAVTLLANRSVKSGLQQKVPGYFMPIAASFLYSEGTEEHRILSAVDGGDLLSHSEAKQLLNDQWAKKHGFSVAAFATVRKDIGALLAGDENDLKKQMTAWLDREGTFKSVFFQLKILGGMYHLGKQFSEDTQFWEGFMSRNAARMMRETQKDILQDSGKFSPGSGDVLWAREVAGREVWVQTLTPTAIRPVTVLPTRLNHESKQHPHMGASPAWMHVDAAASDVSRFDGPTTDNVEVKHFDNRGIMPAMSPAFSFDSQGRLVTMRFQGDQTDVMLMDPETLEVLSTLEIPPRPTAKNSILALLKSGSIADCVRTIFTDTSGGAYYYLDDLDRMIIPTADNTVWIVQIPKDGKNITQTSEFVLPADINGKLTAVIPAWPDGADGDRRTWFTSRGGTVGLLNLESGATQHVQLQEKYLDPGEEIQNSSACGKNGVFIVSNRALYRFTTGPSGELTLAWRKEYPRGQMTVGKIDDGSGTTPTLMGDDYVAIADGQIPPRVHVYSQEDGSEIGSIPVFTELSAAASENSMVAYDNNLYITNSSGYVNPMELPKGPMPGGIERLQIVGNPPKLVKVWTKPHNMFTPTPKLSANGLIYGYQGVFNENGTYTWSLVGIDHESGEEAYKLTLAENTRDPSFDNAWATFTIGPTGVLVCSWTGMFLISDRDKPASREALER